MSLEGLKFQGQEEREQDGSREGTDKEVWTPWSGEAFLRTGRRG